MCLDAVHMYLIQAWQQKHNGAFMLRLPICRYLQPHTCKPPLSHSLIDCQQQLLTVSNSSQEVWP